GEKLARWQPPKGRTRTAPLTASGDRIRLEAATFTARFRDGQGVVVEAATGCRSEDAARQVLAGLEREAERVRAGLITPAEARTAEHLATPIAGHVDGYIGSLEAKGASGAHVRESRRILTAVFSSCEFRTLADLDRGAFERHLNRRRQAGASA